MSWTKTTPTEPGYYFVRNPDNNGLNCMVEIICDYEIPEVYFHGDERPYGLAHRRFHGAEWQGPIYPKE